MICGKWVWIWFKVCSLDRMTDQPNTKNKIILTLVKYKIINAIHGVLQALRTGLVVLLTQ